MAPPPGTMEAAFEALLTTMIASFNDLSASSINCSAPPLIIIVAVLELGHCWNKLNLSAPICASREERRGEDQREQRRQYHPGLYPGV